ncbi:MAG: hypothetical protein JO300_06010, partial [Silvibacterium sp.]|nr:hypothetical protein [Silvibacterium sp.]
MFSHFAFAQITPGHSVWDTRAIPLFRHLQFPRDLPSTGTVIAQDKTGMIWIGTEDGLVRWDGYRSRVFRHNPKDPLSLAGNYVTGLVADEDGTLFVVVNTGVVAIFDPVEENFRQLPSVTTATGSIYNSVISDGNHGLWIGNSNGLSHFDAATKHWDIARLPADTKVWSVLLAGDGTLWIGTEQGLLRYDQTKEAFTPVEGHDAEFSAGIRSLFQSANGNVWFGKNDGTLGMIGRDDRVRLVNQIQPANQILGMAEVKPGILSIATRGAGLNFFDEASGKVIQNIRYDPGRPSGLGGNIIFSEFLDRSGGLWVSHERGADYLAPGTDAFLSLLPSDRDLTAFSGSNVATLAPRPDGSMWFGTDAGGEVFSPLSGRVEASPTQVNDAKLPGVPLSGFAVTGPDQTWVTGSRGLFLREKGHLKEIQALSNTPVRSLLPEGNVLWIGTERRGLVRFDIADNRFTFFTHDPDNPHSISDNRVQTVARDHRGRLWVATNHGLNLLDEGSFIQFHYDPANPDGLPSDTVLTLLVDRKDRLWMGTLGGGVAVLDDNAPGIVNIRRISPPDGSLSNSVDKLIEDEQGQIWGSTDSGLIRIDPITLSARAFGSTDGVAVSAYWAGAGARAADGTLLFGGVGGVTVVHPERLSDKKATPPPIVVTAVHFGGHVYSSLKPLVLPPADHNLQVEFAALDYARSDKISYAYKLAGFDKDWIYTDADHRQAVYTNLPPRQYVLLLRASVSKDIWTDQPTQLLVTVLPAWYQTWWFKIGIALAALGAIVLFVRSRTALLRRRQKELEG